MDMIIAILLWLGCITAPNTYHIDQINTYATQQQPVINSVLTDPPLYDSVWYQYGSIVPEVDVYDPYQ